MAPIVNPEIPYTGDIPGGLQAGHMCRIQGVTLPEADRFNINLQTGPNSSPRDDTALHISVRLNQGYIARNSFIDGEWGDEQGDGDLPIGPAQSWEIIILVDHSDYKIAVNGRHHCEFPHRIPFDKVSHLLVDGQVSVTLISWEGITGVAGGESQSRAHRVDAEGPPQQGYGPPPQGYGQPGQVYGQPGQGYGPPQQGYGPPAPPGAQPESGFDNFLDSAQSMLAGAIKSGAAEKLLGGLLSSGGNQNQQGQQGYAHQNAQYGIYPDLPKDLEPNVHDKKQAPGPVENLLSGLLSGGNKQPAQHGTQPTQQQAFDFGSLLSGVLGGNQQPQQADPVPPTRPNPQQNVNANPQNQAVDFGSILGGLLSGGAQQQQQGATQQNVPANTQHQGVDFGSILGGLLSGHSHQQPAQAQQPANQQNVTGNTQHQGVDFGSILGGLLSGGAQQPGQAPQQYGQVPQQSGQAPPAQQSAGQHQGVDFGSLLGGLLSGGKQQGQAPPPQQAAAQQNASGNAQNQADIGSFLSGLLSSGNQQPGQAQAPQNQQPGQTQAPAGQHSQGVDFGSILGGLLGPNQQKQPGQAAGNAPQQSNVDVGALLTGLMSHIQTRPIQETNNPGHPQAPPIQRPAQGQGGFDMNSLLSGLLSGGGQGGHQPAAGPQLPPGGGQQQRMGGGQVPTGGNQREAPKPMSQGDYEDVTDQLAQLIAQENRK